METREAHLAVELRRDERLYGLMAEFETAEALRAAAARMREMGYTRLEAYSPFPVDGLPEAVGFRKNRVPLAVLGGGLFGAAAGYGLQFYINVIDYPLNVGGRPYHSWPAFIPVTFELTILFASFAAVIAMFVLNRLGRIYHPVFNVPRFARASVDRFFLCVPVSDERFDRVRTWEQLVALAPVEVNEVEQETE